jgi:hypothetical protein
MRARRDPFPHTRQLAVASLALAALGGALGCGASPALELEPEPAPMPPLVIAVVAPTSSPPPPKPLDLDCGAGFDSLGLASAAFDVSCPPGCASDGGSVWGSDVYTADSSVCRAAIHAGLASEEAGGSFTVASAPGRDAYDGSRRHGVTTQPWGSYAESFVLHPLGAIATSAPTTEADALSLRCATTASTFAARALAKSGGGLRVTCPAGCGGETVWGTDLYTDDSAVCAAAIHAGRLTATGGEVEVVIEAGAPAYAGTTRNGITSQSWAQWSQSFRFP